MVPALEINHKMMILELVASWTLATLLTFILIQIVTTAIRNKKAQSFFKRKLPNLPVLPNPGLFSGHIDNLFHTNHNCHKIDRLHKKYGPTFGWYYCNRPAVSTTDLDIIKKMALDDPDNNINRFDPDAPLAELKSDSILVAKDALWYRLRKTIAPAFTNHKIMEPSVQDEMKSVIRQFTNSIDDRLSQAVSSRDENYVSVDAEDVSKRYSLALVFRCFYKQENIIDFSCKDDFYVSIIRRAMHSCIDPILKFCAMFPIVIPSVDWLIDNFHPYGQMERIVMGFMKQQTLSNLKARQQVGQKHSSSDGRVIFLNDGTKFRRNMMDYVIDNFHSGKLNESEYLHNIAAVFQAANVTSADAISNLIYNLAAHQNVQHKLRESILAEGVESEYLQWCIDESLRLHPPVPMGCSRVLGRDMMTKSGLIPAGTFVYTPILTIHRMTEFWGNDASEYKPERWLKAKSFHPAQYLAFGAGKRNCLGKEFALRGIKMLFDTTLRRYKFQLSTGTVRESVPYFNSPSFLCIVADEPTYVVIKHLSENNPE